MSDLKKRIKRSIFWEIREKKFDPEIPKIILIMDITQIFP